MIDKKCHNVAKPEWLVRALGSDKPLTELIQFTPDDMIFATNALQEQFVAESDMDNDSETSSLIVHQNLSQSHDQEDLNVRSIFCFHFQIKESKQNSYKFVGWTNWR